MVKIKRTANISVQSLGAEWRLLEEIVAAGDQDQKHLAIEQAIEAVESFPLSTRNIEQLKTALARAVMDTGEPVSQEGSDRSPASIRIMASSQAVDARAGSEENRAGGWGYFLIEKMAQEAQLWGETPCHVIELFLYLEGEIQAKGKEQ